MGISAIIFCLTLDLNPTNYVIKDSLNWSDANGKHLVVINERSSGKLWSEKWESVVEITFYNILESGKKIKEWNLIEKSGDSFSKCHYLKETLQSIDLDGDKINEVLFFVNISPEGYDPSLTKFIVYSSSEKKVFKIEGVIPKNWGDLSNYKININPLFSESPNDKFTKFCIETWEKYFIKERSKW